jgi:TolB-like protein/class 3 adenylate cyclase/Flp pilus assembly protein TadD
MRRLAAVVVADIVGYSRMMEADESGTLARVRALQTEIVEPTTHRYRGRVVKTTGDGWLAEFSSVTDAVGCSLEIQTEVEARDAALEKEDRLALRIGVNLGEIVVDGSDVYGTGVNVAARLESIAKPGGVCVSDSVYEQIHGIVDVRVEAMGEQAVKNLVKPVRSFMIYPRRTKPPAPTGSPSVGAILDAEPAGTSIAVLPFANLSGDPSQEYFVDGMVDDILTALSRFKWLIVIARQSSFAYKGRSVDVRDVGRDLGVRYVLEGSVQKSGPRVRITAQLIEAATGSHVWADRFEGELEDVFDLQDRLTEQVVVVLEPQIRRAEIERARRARPDSLDAYDLFLRALPHAYAMRPEDNEAALGFLEKALRIDPDFVPAQAFAAWCYEQRLTRGWPAARPEDATRATRLAHATIQADTQDATLISIAGFVLVMVGREYDAGLGALRRAVGLNPYNIFVLMNAGWMEVFAGSLADAVELLGRARSLNPHDPAAFYVLSGLAMAHALARRWEEAIDLATASAAIYGEWDATYFVLGVALAYAGRTEEARVAVAKLIGLTPGMSAATYPGMLPIRDPERRALLEEGLRLAGMPDRR